MILVGSARRWIALARAPRDSIREGTLAGIPPLESGSA
jgi:hypothetical protein